MGDFPAIPNISEQVFLDVERTRRRGYPEAVLCKPKSIPQLTHIAEKVRRSGEQTLFTRATPEQAEAVAEGLPDAGYPGQRRLLAWPPGPPHPSGGTEVAARAGTQ